MSNNSESFIGDYSRTVPIKHKDRIINITDEYDNTVSVKLLPCISVEHVHSRRQILDIRKTCLEQLKNREKDRRYWVEYRLQPTVNLTIDKDWPKDVLDILDLRYRIGNDYVLPVQIGEGNDIYHNVNGFLWVIENIINADRWYDLKWRVYTSLPIYSKDDDRSVTQDRSIVSPYNLQLVQAFETEEKVRWYVNNIVNARYDTAWEYYYLFYYDEFQNIL